MTTERAELLASLEPVIRNVLLQWERRREVLNTNPESKALFVTREAEHLADALEALSAAPRDREAMSEDEKLTLRRIATVVGAGYAPNPVAAHIADLAKALAIVERLAGASGKGPILPQAMGREAINVAMPCMNCGDVVGEDPDCPIHYPRSAPPLIQRLESLADNLEQDDDDVAAGQVREAIIALSPPAIAPEGFVVDREAIWKAVFDNYEGGADVITGAILAALSPVSAVDHVGDDLGASFGPGSRVCDPEPLAASQPAGADPSRGEG